MQNDKNTKQNQNSPHCFLSNLTSWVPWSQALRITTILSNVGCRISDVGCRMLDVGCRISDVGCRMSDVGCRMSDVGCRISDVRCRMSNLGCRMSDVECRISDLGCWMSDGTCKVPLYMRHCFEQTRLKFTFVSWNCTVVGLKLLCSLL